MPSTHRQYANRLNSVLRELLALARIKNPQKRGRRLEAVLDRLFRFTGILLRPAYTVSQLGTGVILEQIDGAIEIDGRVVLVEAKCHKKRLGKAALSPHLLRIYQRPEVFGLVISASPFTRSAIAAAKAALHHKTVVLCELREIVYLLKHRRDIAAFLRAKFRAASLEMNPLVDVLNIGIL